MTLIEKFSNLLPWYNEQDNKNKSEACVQIADDHAIRFKNYCDKKYRFNIEELPTEKLLEIYKKESGL